MIPRPETIPPPRIRRGAFPASWLPAGEESHASYTSAHTGPSPSQDDGHYWRSGVATTAVTAESV